MAKEEKAEFNYFRKLWHLLGLVIPISYYLDIFHGMFGLEYATRSIVILILLFCLLLLIVMETVRLQSQGFSEIFSRAFGFLMKENEKNQFNATLPYFAATTFVVAFFPAEIAILSLVFLVVGDPAAAYFGTFYGKHKFSNGKSLEGILAFTVASLLVGFLFISLFQISDSRSHFLNDPNTIFISKLSILLPSVLLAGITELYVGNYCKGLIDDNLLIPLVSALVLAVASHYVLSAEWQQVFLNPLDLVPGG